MEIFYSNDIRDGVLRLDAEETAHCCKVLRHRSGDEISVIDGRGTLYRCRLLDDGGATDGAAPSRRHPSSRSGETASAAITGREEDWGGHPYRLTLAVCPTKNPDRFEWMAEKVTEIGVDVIAPVIGERSERRVLKTDRLQRILLSAAKQSLKGAVPQLDAPVSVTDFIGLCRERKRTEAELRMIAYCSDDVRPRAGVMERLKEFFAGEAAGKPEITVLIGPEGDFSPVEVQDAISAGFIPVHLGPSRLRTETAAVTAAEAVYLSVI